MIASVGSTSYFISYSITWKPLKGFPWKKLLANFKIIKKRNAGKILENSFLFDFLMKGRPILFDELKLCKT